MARKKRAFTTFSLSFLDIMSCGFGAVILVFLIIDHSIEVQSKELNQDLLSEVDLLNEDISAGEKDKVRLRNTLSEVSLEVVEAPEGAVDRGREIEQQLLEYDVLHLRNISDNMSTWHARNQYPINSATRSKSLVCHGLPSAGRAASTALPSAGL